MGPADVEIFSGYAKFLNSYLQGTGPKFTKFLCDVEQLSAL